MSDTPDEYFSSVVEKINNTSVSHANFKSSRKVAILLIYDKPPGQIGEIRDFIKTHLPVEKAVVREYDPRYEYDPVILFP